MPPFHYGSHYSAAGVVLFYLIRLEPFTRLNRNLQVCDLIPYLEACLFLFVCLWGHVETVPVSTLHHECYLNPLIHQDGTRGRKRAKAFTLSTKVFSAGREV